MAPQAGGGGAAAPGGGAGGARLAPRALALHLLAAPALLALFLAGAAGLVIFMDLEFARTHLNGTAFQRNWVWLISKNAFCQPFALNFGAIGFGYCISQLLGHYHSAPPAPAAAAKKRL